MKLDKETRIILADKDEINDGDYRVIDNGKIQQNIRGKQILQTAKE